MQQTGYREYQRLKKDSSMIDQILLSPIEIEIHPVYGRVVWRCIDTIRIADGWKLIDGNDHWREFLTYWTRIPEDMQHASEQQLSSSIQELLNQWKWYEEARRLMEDDLMTAWRELEEWRFKLESPGRWMAG
jgi:hypothetical protein